MLYLIATKRQTCTRGSHIGSAVLGVNCGVCDVSPWLPHLVSGGRRADGAARLVRRCGLPAHSSGWKIHFGAKLTRWAVNAKSGHVADLTFVQSTQSSRSFGFKRKRVACVPIRFRQTRDTGSWSRRPTLFGHVAVGRPRA